MEKIILLKQKILALDLKTIDANELKWDGIFDVFIRVLAILTLLRGVFYWACITGFDTKVDFMVASPAFQYLLVFSAIVSLIAGVGLWMMNKWGNSLWLFLVIVVLVVDFMALVTPNMSQDLTRPFHKTMFDLFLIVIYFGISIQTALWQTKHLRV